jgi:hypothetical protein
MERSPNRGKAGSVARAGVGLEARAVALIRRNSGAALARAPDLRLAGRLRRLIQLQNLDQLGAGSA